MAYKEVKLEKGQAKDLYNLWNSGMEPPKKKTASAKKQEKPKKK